MSKHEEKNYNLISPFFPTFPVLIHFTPRGPSFHKILPNINLSAFFAALKTRFYFGFSISFQEGGFHRLFYLEDLKGGGQSVCWSQQFLLCGYRPCWNCAWYLVLTCFPVLSSQTINEDLISLPFFHNLCHLGSLDNQPFISYLLKGLCSYK